MKRHYLATFVMMTGFCSIPAHALPGEYWEITNKMEMPGMPFAMPGSTIKVCIAKGAEKDPKKASGDKDCQMTDVKTVGNKTIWKMSCNHDGEVMTGTGEQTFTAGGYEGKMQFSGKSHGHDSNMTMAFSGKRVGGSCDSEEQVKKAEEQIKKIQTQMCDTSRYHGTADWINGADLIFQKDSPCANQRQQLCDLVRKDSPRDVRSYNALVMHDQHMGSVISVANECKVDMSVTTKSICKTLNGDNYNQLSAHCPAEAKTYREVQRRKDCEGRSFTAETRAADIKNCLNGKSNDSDESKTSETSSPQKSGKTSGSNPAMDALEAAKKLRSKFGF